MTRTWAWKNSRNPEGVLNKAAYCPDSVHEILHSFIASFVCYMCEILHDQYEYFKELHKEQGYNWPTIYRAGTAVVSTITSLEALVMHATRCNIWQATWPSSMQAHFWEFGENFGDGSLHAGFPELPQAINPQLIFPSQLRPSYWKASEQPLMSELNVRTRGQDKLYQPLRTFPGSTCHRNRYNSLGNQCCESEEIDYNSVSAKLLTFYQ